MKEEPIVPFVDKKEWSLLNQQLAKLENEEIDQFIGDNASGTLASTCNLRSASEYSAISSSLLKLSLTESNRLQKQRTQKMNQTLYEQSIDRKFSAPNFESEQLQ